MHQAKGTQSPPKNAAIKAALLFELDGVRIFIKYNINKNGR
jgi:hypothetical protein